MNDVQAAKQITDAMGAHGLWKARLRESIEKGTSASSIETVRADGACAFGKWLGEARPPLSTSVEFGKVKALHARFHQAAASVLKLAMEKRKREAEEAMNRGEFADVSASLVRELAAWRARL